MSHNDTFILKVLREPCLKQPQRTKYKSSDGTVFQIVRSNPINLSVHFTLEIIFILSRTKFPLQNRFQCLLQQELIHAKFYLKSFEADAGFTLALGFALWVATYSSKTPRRARSQKQMFSNIPAREGGAEDEFLLLPSRDVSSESGHACIFPALYFSAKLYAVSSEAFSLFMLESSMLQQN